MNSPENMMRAATSGVRNALAVRHDSPNEAFKLLIASADLYEQLEMTNLSQTALEYAWELQLDTIGGDYSQFAEQIRDARIISFAKHLPKSEA